MRPDTPSPSARSPYHGQPKSVWSATTTSPDRSCSPSSSSSRSSTTTATSLPSSYYQVCSPLSPTLPGMPVSDHSRSHPLKNHHSFSTLSGHQKETSTSVPLKPSLLSSVWSKQQKQVYSFKENTGLNLGEAIKRSNLVKSVLIGDRRFTYKINSKGNEKIQGIEDYTKVADGGCLAWTIVAASFMVSFLQDGFRDSFGLLLPSISQHFNTGRTEAALTNSIMTFLTLGSGPLVAALVQRWGHRSITIIGVCMATAGLLLAGFSIEYLTPPSLFLLYTSVGLMTGLGFGLMYLPAMDIIELYFDRNLGLATGIAAAGSGLGQLIMAPVIHVIQEAQGLAFTIIFLAGSVAFAIFFALIYRAPDAKRGKDDDLINGVLSDMGIFHQGVQITGYAQKKDFSLRPVVDGKWEKKSDSIKEDDDDEHQGCLAAYASIFRQPEMVVLLISHFLMHIAIFAAFAFTADRATLELDIDRHRTSLLLSIMGISNCVGRIVFGKILDAFRTRAFCLTTVVLVVNAAIVTVSVWTTTFLGQAVYAGVFGATFGAYISSLVVILKLINKDKITDSLGVCLMVFALASLVGPAIVGQIFDAQGSYRTGFLVARGLGLVGALIFPLVNFITSRK